MLGGRDDWKRVNRDCGVKLLLDSGGISVVDGLGVAFPSGSSDGSDLDRSALSVGVVAEAVDPSGSVAAGVFSLVSSFWACSTTWPKSLRAVSIAVWL